MEEFKMARQSKREYLRSIHARYQRAGRGEKRLILEEFCKVCGYNRKYAIWLLNRPLSEAVRRQRRTGRAFTYSRAMVEILAKVWKASGYLCSQRLKAAVVPWLPWIRQRFPLSAELERQLRAISPRQMDRRLLPYKQRVKRKLYGTTRPGSLLKQLIPIKTDHWDVHTAGYLEIDLVSHCGASAIGEFIFTLDGVDIATCWVERQAVMGKGGSGTSQAVEEIEVYLPFRLRGIDSDNGSEFINNHLFTFCQKRSLQFTRSRPYKKDDNAHVEQKNWTHVRKLLGWDRYDTQEALLAINQLYEKLRVFQNLFQPSMKLECKIRKGSRLIRRYDTPRTPFERVVECQEADPKKVAVLYHTLKTTDPFELSEQIDRDLDRLYRLARRADRAPRETPPLRQVQKHAGSSSPWRDWTFSKKLKQQKQEMERQRRQPPG
jgi:hypothetical protein